MDYFVEPSDVGPGCVLVRQQDPEGWLLFTEPTSVLTANTPQEVLPLLRQVDALTEAGNFVAGLLTYEAGAGMDPAIQTQPSDFPHLAWFAVYRHAPIFKRELAPHHKPISLHQIKDGISEESYGHAFHRIKEAIREGKSYQVNLTYPTRFQIHDDAFSLFQSRCGIDPPPHAAFVHGGSWQVASLSPELLIHREGDWVKTQPMKGTAPLGSGEELRSSKSFAENLMIVDMVRNDLGKVAQTGSVKAPRLMEVETHGSILQMTSTVEATIKIPNSELFRSVFPPASITGAPKVSSCSLIAELETHPRGVYCGTVGYLGPQNFAHLNVAIRTAVFRDDQPRELSYGVGGGIVWDSTLEAEYAETRLKLKGLTEPKEGWKIVEAFHREAPSETVLAHLDRLQRTAAQFKIPFNMEDCLAQIRTLNGTESKVRITLDRTGHLSVSLQRSMLPEGELGFKLATTPVNSQDSNLQIKTNSRRLYNAQRVASGADDVLFFNEREELTEFSTGSLVVQIDGQLYTPPADCGCLPGITVGQLIRDKKMSEMRLSISDLDRCQRIYLANGVIGLRPIRAI